MTDLLVLPHVRKRIERYNLNCFIFRKQKNEYGLTKGKNVRCRELWEKLVELLTKHAYKFGYIEESAEEAGE